MRRFLLLLCIGLSWHFIGFSQKLYTMSGGELIFQSSVVEKGGNDVNSNMRFTLFLHIGEFLHYDITKNVGLFTGIGMRNVGLITEEEDIKIKYRTYNLGIPIAVKLGSFENNLYVFGGAEYEWMFQFKQKVFVDGGKYKFTSWFGKRTPAFIPSVFAGVHFPGGVQVQFRYYLNDYLNHEFNGGEPYDDYTQFSKTQVWYISMSYLIRNSKIPVHPKAPADIAGL